MLVDKKTKKFNLTSILLCKYSRITAKKKNVTTLSETDK